MLLNQKSTYNRILFNDLGALLPILDSIRASYSSIVTTMSHFSFIENVSKYFFSKGTQIV